MPPLRFPRHVLDIDRRFTPEALANLRAIGHLGRVVVGDTSLLVPDGCSSAYWLGESSADALRATLQLIPVEAGSRVTLMGVDSAREPSSAYDRLRQVVDDLSLDFEVRKRLGSDGFYNLAQEAAATTYLLTGDPRPYACAQFVVGHSQVEPR